MYTCFFCALVFGEAYNTSDDGEPLWHSIGPVGDIHSANDAHNHKLLSREHLNTQIYAHLWPKAIPKQAAPRIILCNNAPDTIFLSLAGFAEQNQTQDPLICIFLLQALYCSCSLMRFINLSKTSNFQLNTPAASDASSWTPSFN